MMYDVRCVMCTYTQTVLLTTPTILLYVLHLYCSMLKLKTAQFRAVLNASNLDPVMLQKVTSKLDNMISVKNAHISELQYDVARISKVTTNHL